jgi:glycosyltransferase involved in cell wall biosynthesis
MQALVSVCIPTYNGLQYLKECIDSAIGQTYSNIEIVICDDCSTDGTWDLVNTYAAKDNRIKAFRNDKNLGLVGNWNKCIGLVKGEWIKFLFQDDYLDTDCIAEMVQGILEGDKLVTSGRRLIFDPGLDEKVKEYSLSQTLTFERLGINSSVPVNITAERISEFAVDNICMNFIGEPTVIMFRKDCVADVGYFNADISQLCDLEYFLRIASKYGLKYIPRQLTWFRVHRQSTSSSHMKNKLFMLNYLDPIIITHQLLFAPQYDDLRKAIAPRRKVKLTQYFRVRTYEAKKVAMLSNNEDILKFKAISGKYHQIESYANGSIITKIAYSLIKLKRAITKKA